MNRLILALLPLLLLALAAGAEASILADGFAPEASDADAGAAVELSQHEETYGDDNYYDDQGYGDGYSDEYTDEYGDALPEDQAAEDEYAEDEYADEGYEDEYTGEQGYQEGDEYDVTQDDYYYDKDPKSLVQPGDTLDPYAPE